MTASLIASLLSRCKRRVPVAPSVPSLRSSHTASLIASLLLRCIPRVPVAPSVPLLRSSHDGVAHCFASLALQAACACGAIGPFASLVTWRCCSLLRFSRVAYGVCLWRRRPHSLRSSHGGVAGCFASLALQTACACGAVGPFASLVTLRRRSLLPERTQSRAEQGSAEQCRAEHGRAGQSRAEQSRAEHSRAEQSRAAQSRAEQGRAEQSRAGQGRAEQGSAGQISAE